MRKMLAIGVAVVLSATACGGHNPAGPNAVESLAEWSPYLGVHAFGIVANQQQPHLLPLLEHGAVRGIRLDMYGYESELLANWVMNNGAEVLGIFPNEELQSEDAWTLLAAKLRRNPDIRYWEMGNEVQMFATMNPQEYLRVYLSLYDRAKAEFPEVVLIPAAPVGVTGGTPFFRELLDGGVLRLTQDPDPSRRLLVVALHYYSVESTYPMDIKRQVERLPADTQIWVTETGVNNRASHIEYVKAEYPRMRSLLRATRIYWYVFSECTEYSLVGGLAETCQTPPQPSPLYQLLVGAGGKP